MDIEIRPIRTLSEYEACLELQRETWGDDFNDCVPVSILMVTQRVGGITAGAFDPAGNLLGCIYGITGLESGRPIHWSDILAVKEEARGRGLGKRLKLYQRAELLKRGIETMQWTYDPLQALNANLNFNGLGARPIEYVVDMYGETGSALHAGLGTDRFVVQWDMASDRVGKILGGEQSELDPEALDAPIVNTVLKDGRREPIEAELPEAELVRVEIPASINDVKLSDPDAGARWRACTRQAFQHYLQRGFEITNLISLENDRFFYTMKTRD